MLCERDLIVVDLAGKLCEKGVCHKRDRAGYSVALFWIVVVGHDMDTLGILGGVLWAMQCIVAIVNANQLFRRTRNEFPSAEDEGWGRAFISFSVNIQQYVL